MKKDNNSDGNGRKYLVTCNDIFTVQLSDGTESSIYVDYIVIEIPKKLAEIITTREIFGQLNLACYHSVEKVEDLFKYIKMSNPNIEDEKTVNIGNHLSHISNAKNNEFPDSRNKDVIRIISQPIFGLKSDGYIKQTVLSEMLREMDIETLYQFKDMPEIEKMDAIFNMLLSKNSHKFSSGILKDLREFFNEYESKAIENNYHIYEIRDNGSFTIERNKDGRNVGYSEYGKQGEKLTEDEKKLAKELFFSNKDYMTRGFYFFLENGGFINHSQKTSQYGMQREGEIFDKTDKGMEYRYSITKRKLNNPYETAYDINLRLSENGEIKLDCYLDKEVSYEELIKKYPDVDVSNLQKKIAVLLSKGVNISTLPFGLRVNKYTMRVLKDLKIENGLDEEPEL